MIMLHGPQETKDRIRSAKQLRLFLDYDGTLAEFAPTPDDILPDPSLIYLLGKLRSHPSIQVSVISGRRLSHIHALLPIEGILLAGTYGIEILTPVGKRVNRLDFHQIRPTLEAIKPLWEKLIISHKGFYLEDKGWSLALHARYAEPEFAEEIIDQAKSIAKPSLADKALFRILGGNKFLEVAPRLANKGYAIEYLLTEDPLKGALSIFIGDDDKDEEAFDVILNNRGVAIKVSPHACETRAQLRLESTEIVRQWLNTLLQS